jgi:hypothetical protein
MSIRNMLRPFGILYGYLAILWQYCIFFTDLAFCIKKNLATQLHNRDAHKDANLIGIKLDLIMHPY